jgi:peptide chain release factor 1
MEERLKQISGRYQEIERLISDPVVIADRTRYTVLMKERGGLARIVSRVEALDEVKRHLRETELLVQDKTQDASFTQMANEELVKLQQDAAAMTQELEEMLIGDEADYKNVIVEIRAGVGGDEAALFTADLFKMYFRYAESKGWRTILIDSSPTNLGGFKEINFSIEGELAYKHLRYESGTHRVQRVPRTEASGRIHTSACTVAVLPEAEDVDIEIKSEDLKVDTYSAGGPGGQHVNKTASAIRITHIPSGLVVACMVERSQHRNRDLAMRLLRTRLYEHQVQQNKQERDLLRKNQIGTGDRSEKIRTYNFSQNRVTDHRINVSLYDLPRVLDGNMDELLDQLIKADKEARLKQASQLKKDGK